MRPELRQGLGYTTIGIELVLSILFGYVAGNWLDGKLGTAPVLAIVGFVVGTAAGFRALYRAAKRLQREAEKDGWKDSLADRPAKFALDEKEHERKQRHER